MITKLDEFLCHQIVSSFDEVYTTDQQWYDRLWLTAHDNSGKILIDVGFGKYINRNVMDAHGGVTMEDRTQYTVRASRELWPDLDSVEVGPLRYEVLEPLRKIHVCLKENDYGISFEMEFEGQMVPWDEEPSHHRLPGIMTVHSRRYYQFGHVNGKVTVEGKAYEINKDTWWGQRDRSWGIRPIGVPRPGGWWSRADAGVPESGLQPWPHIPGLFFHYLFVQFKDYGLVFTFSEAPDGTPAGAHGGMVYRFGDNRFPVPVTDVQHKFEFLPGSRRVKSIELIVTTADGTKRDILVKPLNVFYARTGGYLDGYKGWVQGKWRGPFAIDGERLDLADPKVRDELQGAVDDTMCEFRCGDDVGYGILEPFVIGELPKYGFKA